jgi:TolB protein
VSRFPGDPFTSSGADGSVSQIYVMNADASDAHAVTHGKAENIHPTWSPGSGYVLFDTTHFAARVAAADSDKRPIGDATDDAMDLAVVRPDGEGLRRITTSGGCTYASYSPDGRFILHRRIRGADSRIAVVNADGTGDHDPSRDSGEDGWPSWSPDGKRVVFARHVGEDFEIFVMNADGGDVRQLTAAKGRFTNPRWSPDAKTILCSRGLGSMSLVVFAAPP